MPRRKRRIAVADKHRRRCFVARAERVGLIKDFYTAHRRADPAHIDRQWTDIEARLASALDALIDGSIDGLTWAGTLVPFIASLFVRGPDFNERFEDRSEQIIGDAPWIPEGNTNSTRPIELQRLLAPVLAAHWIVAEVQGSGTLVTNDVGFVGFKASTVGAIGVAIPIGLRHVLQLVPSPVRAVSTLRDGIWMPNIQYLGLSDGNHLELNKLMAGEARRFVFGRDVATVEALLDAADVSRAPVPEPAMLGFASGLRARLNEFAWHWLVSILSKPATDRSAWSEIDWNAVARIWKTTVIFPLNVPMALPALTRVGDTIFIDLESAVMIREDEHHVYSD